jgi:membrane associated rhomboid family serine protease/antitoxin component YwqK of YwqJK toxin-antitoxin module
MQFVGETLKKMPATLGLVVINCVVFYWLYSETGTFDEPLWSLGLLDLGALYNPYALGGEWYRIFTNMFLHGSFLHLASNMFALLAVGQSVEKSEGTKEFLFVYFLSGIAASLGSLYFNLFTVGVGASGAIFGIVGYELMMAIRRRDQDGKIISLVVFLVLFLAASVVFGEALRVDHAAHVGGLVCGLLLSVIASISGRNLIAHLIVSVLLIIIFFSLPRFQVHYFNFFQEVLMAQDSSNYVLNNSDSKSNEEFLEDYRRVTMRWDTAMNMLNALTDTPEELASDTFKLRRLIRYHKAQGDYRIIMVENESYIYADSIGVASDSIRKYTTLDYVLNLKYSPPDTTNQKSEGPPLEIAKIWFDSNWVEIPYPPAEYFRVGQRDTAGLWQGQLVDYFKNGQPQMKGSYKDDMKDGIFIYYTAKGKYSAAGVYNEDQRVGKWETFHPNGKIESEVYYRDRYFLKSYWDSTGMQMVRDGFGKEIHRYSNGVIASEGQYADGYQEGYWYGRHPDGKMYFEENYNRGRLINGRSRSKSGRIAIYDATTLFALPEGGYKKFNEHIRSKVDPQGLGTVKLSFRVTVDGRITDFKIEQSVSKELDMRAKQIVLTGPRWLPARLHGLEPTDGFAFVAIEF